MSKPTLPGLVSKTVTFILLVSVVISIIAVSASIKEVFNPPLKTYAITSQATYTGWSPVSFSYTYIHPAVRYYDKTFPALKYIWVLVVNPLILLAWLLLLYHLRKLLVNIAAKKEFTMENMSTVRFIGICSVVISLLYFLQWGFLIMGLITIVLSEVFRSGFTIKEENKLTV